MIKKIILVISLLLLPAAAVFVANKHVSPAGWRWWGDFYNSQGVAIQGYDPVSYFKLQRATPGSPDFQYEWQGVRWYFDSAEHQQLFVASPDDYAPQFGGYCASGVGYGVTAKSDPKVWHIQEDKLYLFGREKVRQSWLKKRNSGIIERAEKFWH